jgi:Domain of unknown function (DUF4360)
MPETNTFMRSKPMRTPLVLIALTISGCLFYTHDIALAKPGYGGSGCPGGSASVTLSGDQTALRLAFTKYQVAAGGATGKLFERKSCNLAIPIVVPQGRSVSILAVDYRGSTRLSRGASSQFSVEYFFAGGRGPTFGKTFAGPLDKAYLVSTGAGGWSSCGGAVTLRSNSSIKISTTSGAVSPRAEHVQTAATYHLQWRSCR